MYKHQQLKEEKLNLELKFTNLEERNDIIKTEESKQESEH